MIPGAQTAAPRRGARTRAPCPDPISFRRRVFDWTRPYVAGVLNVTPDSFSDGGRFLDVSAAVERGRELARAGADLIDIGGESTRPGATAVSAAEEIDRVIPVIAALARELDVPISVDTTKAAVARAALEAGAEVVNDVTGGAFDPELPEVAAARGAAFVCGHVRGRTLVEVHAAEDDPPGFAEVTRELEERLASLPAALVARTIVDPGLGFGKGTAQNLELLRRAGELASALSRPVMVGPSRKRFLGELTGRDVGDRDAATAGAALGAVACGAHVVRVHAVELVAAALAAFAATVGEAPPPGREARP